MINLVECTLYTVYLFLIVEALVESTVFSPNIEQDDFYEAAISTWLSDCAGVVNLKF